MTIVFKRWHWLMFVVLWFTQVFGSWVTLARAPDGPAVLRFVWAPGWFLGAVRIVSYTAGSAFLTTAVFTKLLEAVVQSKKQRAN